MLSHFFSASCFIFHTRQDTIPRAQTHSFVIYEVSELFGNIILMSTSLTANLQVILMGLVMTK